MPSTRKKARQPLPASLPADPTQWSVQSQRSVAFECRRIYTDQAYHCRHCKAPCVFTARDQQCTYEVKKAHIAQRRSLCAACWSESHRLRMALRAYDAQWANARAQSQRAQLETDKAFLDGWLAHLLALETFVPYRADTARKAMLSRLLASI